MSKQNQIGIIITTFAIFAGIISIALSRPMPDGNVQALAAVPIQKAQDEPSRFPLTFQQLGNQVERIRPSEFSQLGDPFFNLVLKENAQITSLVELEEMIQPDADKRKIYVASEMIIDQDPSVGRRAVISFEGENGSEELTDNLMFSISFGAQSLPENPRSIEVWGWDDHRGRYNYYKLDNAGTRELSWKFRGSSENVDLTDASERQTTCMRCHLNGAPLMKELLLPWNNWHSFSSSIDYLRAGRGDDEWPIATDERFRASLAGAQRLEGNIIRSIRRFNTHRISQALSKNMETGGFNMGDEGLQTVMEGQRLLRPLFETTEFNIISSKAKSNLHPFDDDTSRTTEIILPTTFFLNERLIKGGGIPRYHGLKLRETNGFSRVASLHREEYEQLLIENEVLLDGVKPGDTHFTWLVPEPSHIDVDMADQLLKRGIVTAHFLAAVIAVDLENPVLSQDRASLLSFIPERFDFRPVPADENPLTFFRAEDNSDRDPLTNAVIATIQATEPITGTPAADFLALLQSEDAVKVLRKRIDAYLTRVKVQLGNQETRFAELQRLHEKTITLRRAIITHPSMGNLDETGGQLLFPLPRAIN